MFSLQRKICTPMSPYGRMSIDAIINHELILSIEAPGTALQLLQAKRCGLLLTADSAAVLRGLRTTAYHCALLLRVLH